jgi:hypothetical protein
VKWFFIYERQNLEPLVFRADTAVVKEDSLVLTQRGKEIARFEHSRVTAWKIENHRELEQNT